MDTFEVIPLQGIGDVKSVVDGVDDDKYKGKDICAVRHMNCFLIARKNSGKSTCVFHILKKRVKPGDNIIVVSSTCDQDKIWDVTREKFCRHQLLFFPSIWVMEDDGEYIPAARSPENNVLRHLLDFLKWEKKHGGEDDDISWGNWKNRCTFLVLDDCSLDMHDPVLNALMKQNRHNRITTIVSSQDDIDLNLGCRQQVDLFLLFKGCPRDKLKRIYRVAQPGVEFDEFADIYEHVTSKPYSFLYVGKGKGEMRENFNKRIEKKYNG